jgi:hypothetical protein
MAPSTHGVTHMPQPLQSSSLILTICRFMILALPVVLEYLLHIAPNLLKNGRG